MADIETIYDKLTVKIKASLNTNIAAINVEKGDTLIEELHTNAWVNGSMDERVLNFNVFCFNYLENLETVANGPAVAQNCSFEYDVVFAQKEDFNDYKRFLRYARALMQSACDAWDSVGKGYDRATITLAPPIDVRLFDSSHWHKVVGVKIEFSLTN